MVIFFKGSGSIYFAVGTKTKPGKSDLQKLNWLFGGADYLVSQSIDGFFIGPRKEMITPWSTNAVEITQNMGIIEIHQD